MMDRGTVLIGVSIASTLVGAVLAAAAAEHTRGLKRSVVFALVAFTLCGSAGWQMTSWLQARQAAHPEYVPQTEEARVDAYERMRLKVEEINDLALVIWYEAKGEPYVGQAAVATVIYNRAGGDPERMLEVTTETNWHGCAVSPTDYNGDWGCPVLTGPCYQLAHQLVNGTFQPLGAWTHFYNPQKVLPAWSLTNQVQIGRHLFGEVLNR